jgi:hypothetical protein
MKLDVKQKAKFNLQMELLQPWSTFVMKTQLPPENLQKMLKITDEIIANTKLQRHGLWSSDLHGTGGLDSGEIENEFFIEPEMLVREDLMIFFLDVCRQFIIEQTLQMYPKDREKILKDKWHIQMENMWFSRQMDNEYSPTHIHPFPAMISCSMYLKIPEFLPNKNPIKDTDGSITFITSTRDPFWGCPFMTIQPKVGDLLMFPASQQHVVYPFRTADGKGERRSVTFNAICSKKSTLDAKHIMH